MTEKPVTTGVFDVGECAVAWHHTSLDDLFACAPCMRDLDALTDDTLPERADMPRIMDERATQHAPTRWALSTGGLVAWSLYLCDGCVNEQAHIASCQPMFVRPRIEVDRTYTTQPCSMCGTQDTRTRAQLDDGCVTECSCNGTLD